MVVVTSPDADKLDALAAVHQSRHADLLDRLKDVKSGIDRLSDINADLAGRVSDRLDEAWRDCQDHLAQVNAAAPHEEVWKRLAAAQAAVHRLGQEVLAYTEGALVRQGGADGGCCRLADLVLDHFGAQEKELNWRGFTILAESAFLGDLAEVVRLKYPGTSFWHLPVAAHEFGHFAAPGLRVEVRNGSFRDTTQPVADFLRERWDDHDQKKWFHAHEYFADIFATFALGAAYPYYLLFLEVSPDSVRATFSTHPSWNDRLSVVLNVLERLLPHGGVTAPVVADLRRRWQHVTEASAGTKEPDHATLIAHIDFLLPLLERHLRGLRYASFARAQQLAVSLRQGRPGVVGATPPDVLNAAWLARLHEVTDPDATEVIAKRASEMLEDLG